jgi:hypothetical protein
LIFHRSQQSFQPQMTQMTRMVKGRLKFFWPRMNTDEYGFLTATCRAKASAKAEEHKEL